MRIIHLILFFAIALILNSCAPSYYYQIYDVKAAQENQQSNLIFSDNQCQITYNFWEKNGNASFWFQNKTDKDIYIDLSKCFFVKNNVAFDYFQNRIFGNGHSYAYTLNPFVYTTVSSSNQSTTFFVESKIIGIPANSSKLIHCEYPIVDELYRDCNLIVYPHSNSHWDKASKTYVYDKVPEETFDINNSPLVFSNHIFYYIDSPEQSFRIITEFYINKITNYPSTQIIKDENNITICGKSYYKYHSENKQYAPDKFYYKYESGIQTYDGH